MTDFIHPTPLETVVDMLDDVIDTGLDEDIMGWGTFASKVDANELKRCVENDEAFEAFVTAFKPNLRKWLEKCLEEDTRMKKHSGEL